MSNGQDYGQQGPREQWSPQGQQPGSWPPGQGGGPWQPQAYDPGRHHQRLGQPPRDPYAYPAQPAPQQQVRSHVPAYLAIAAVALAIGGAAGWMLHKPGSAAPSPVASSAAAITPDTAVAAQTAAQQFFTFYSASQWADAWQYLTAADKREAPESVYAAVHQRCSSAAAGMAYAIKDVTLAGQTAVVTYTVSGATGAILGNATMPMTWTAAGWGVEPSGMSVYTHGSISADLAAAKAAGDCSG